MIKRYNGFIVQKLLIELFSTFESDGVYTSGDFLAKLKSLSTQSNNVGEISSAIINVFSEFLFNIAESSTNSKPKVDNPLNILSLELILVIIDLYGLYLLGAFGRAAKRAASS